MKERLQSAFRDTPLAAQFRSGKLAPAEVAINGLPVQAEHCCGFFRSEKVRGHSGLPFAYMSENNTISNPFIQENFSID